MGQCFFISDSVGFATERKYWQDKTQKRVIEIPSEILIDWLNTDGQGQRLLNSTNGIWFYERDLFNKEKLKKGLRDLIKDIDKIKY